NAMIAITGIARTNTAKSAHSIGFPLMLQPAMLSHGKGEAKPPWPPCANPVEVELPARRKVNEYRRAEGLCARFPLRQRGIALAQRERARLRAGHPAPALHRH